VSRRLISITLETSARAPKTSICANFEINRNVHSLTCGFAVDSWMHRCGLSNRTILAARLVWRNFLTVYELHISTDCVNFSLTAIDLKCELGMITNILHHLYSTSRQTTNSSAIADKPPDAGARRISNIAYLPTPFRLTPSMAPSSYQVRIRYGKTR